MAHLVITIGCEYGAKGNQIGRKVAEDLGVVVFPAPLAPIKAITSPWFTSKEIPFNAWITP